MKTKIATLMVIVFFTAISCKNDKKTDKTDDTIDSVTETARTITDMKPEALTVQLHAKSDSYVTGEVVFTQTGDKLVMVANLQGLTPGEHAIHLHEKADCSSDDATSSGGHWNPDDKQHGKWGDENGFHRGDIGNMTADADGNATLTFETDQWCIDCDDATKSIKGRGIIVHQKADDFKTQPTGAAGERVACGEIK